MVRVVPCVWVIGVDGERGTDSVDNAIDLRWDGPLAKTAKPSVRGQNALSRRVDNKTNP